MSDVDHPSRDLSLLAPKFRAAVEAAIEACKAAPPFKDVALEVKINEGFRSNARQAFLFAQGRTRPGDIVTNAPTALTSWHGYGLAVDVIHISRGYEPFTKQAHPDKAERNRLNEGWYEAVAAVFKANGCAWGGDWTKPDTPHMQWAKCRASPSDRARELIAQGGVHAVWSAVGAD